jgi:hypothetical protein
LTAVLFILALFYSPLGQSKVTGFQDSPRGVTLGGGIYYHLLTNDNRFDPAPALGDSGDTFTSSDEQTLLPTKVGFFMQRGRVLIEPFFRYMINKRSNWTVSGTNSGTGYFTFTSWGFGADMGVAMLQSQRFQLNFVLNYEMVFQRNKVTFNPTAGGTESIKLRTTSQLAGVGIAPELWLGDMWTLSIFGGYQYGFTRYWNVENSSSIMGRSFTAGSELLDSSGGRSVAQFGGFLVQGTLRLAFQDIY